MKKLRFVAKAWTAYDPETSASLHVSIGVDSSNDLYWRWSVHIPGGRNLPAFDEGGCDYGKTSAGARKKAREAYARALERRISAKG